MAKASIRHRPCHSLKQMANNEVKGLKNDKELASLAQSARHATVVQGAPP
jgi:hypothetical protein